MPRGNGRRALAKGERAISRLDGQSGARAKERAVPTQALTSAKQIGQEMKAWWEERDMRKLLATQGVLPSYKDLSVLCARHLCQRIADTKTPDEVKDRIALAFAPRITAELKGKLGAGGEASSPMADLMGTYRVGN
jgi:hypothetical protein